MTDNTVKMVRTKCYLVNLSRGDAIKIDQEELGKVLAALQSGTPAVVKQGIINPSYVVSVTGDKDRLERFYEDTKYDAGKRAGGLKPLAELIDRAEVLKSLPPAQRKMLGNGN